MYNTTVTVPQDFYTRLSMSYSAYNLSGEVDTNFSATNTQSG